MPAAAASGNPAATSSQSLTQSFKLNAKGSKQKRKQQEIAKSVALVA